MPKSRCRTQHASGREGKVAVGGRLGRSLPAGPVPNGPTRTPRRRGAGTQSIGPHSLPKVDSEVIEGGVRSTSGGAHRSSTASGSTAARNGSLYES